jgi:hypothetical protein
MMKIALTRKTEKTYHLKNSILMKKTCQIETAQLVPVSAARWHSICQNFSGQTIRKTKQEKATVVRKRHTHIHSKRNPKD